MNRLIYQTFFSFICYALGQQTTENPSTIGTSLIPDQNDVLLMFSTLDGSLIAVEQKTGEIRWHQSDEPAVKIPNESSHLSMPIFLPDPKDGSLYLFGPETEALKKLPFTIPQLVASSPCRSTDGILYTGRKIDTWFNVDPLTGEREQFLGFTKPQNTCPLNTQNGVFVGRTEYNIIMIDSKHKDRMWNVTFYDYSAAKMDKKSVEDYDLAHFTASSTGQVVTLDRFGKILWNIDLGSPVIAIYTINKDGLMTIPFNSVADNTLKQVLSKISVKPSELNFFPTLFIGEHSHGLYALPSLVDSSTPTIVSKSGKLLLEGPKISDSQKNNSEDESETLDEDNFERIGAERDDIIISGHYEVPKEYRPYNQQLMITGRSDPIINTKPNIFNSTKQIDVTVDDPQSNKSKYESNRWHKALIVPLTTSKNWLNQQDKSFAVGVLIIFLTVMGSYFLYAQRKSQDQHRKPEISCENSQNSSLGMNNDIRNEPIDKSWDDIGKISIDLDSPLGTGCNGTTVFRGRFDGREVAVKRILPVCFSLADREVKLLRESDTHPNVVRYFCTEKDKQFQYIALELAAATLQDYVEGEFNRDFISSKSILKQATCGLAHLHSLDIVHRDIKPHNVLLSFPNSKYEVRAMISDFGLCKKLENGQQSVSKKGTTGTTGWIAPEMMDGKNEKTTYAVDIFSLGCVFYYVLSQGQHPFGSSYLRQANISSGEFNLTELKDVSENDKYVALILIKAMIDNDPKQRPSAEIIYNHPLFWEYAKILSFFLDVSDRVEKDKVDSPARLALEKNHMRVVGTDWRNAIGIHVAEDLRKYRSYEGHNVRDLLRALRNKKNHYYELTPEAQEELGEPPDRYTEYWIHRFPCLLIHSWCAMQQFRTEPTLRNYYDKSYTFGTEEYGLEVLTEEINGGIDESANPDIPQSDGKLVEEKIRVNYSQNENNRTVNWSPNRVRSPRQKKYQQRNKKKKAEETYNWIPPSDNATAKDDSLLNDAFSKNSLVSKNTNTPFSSNVPSKNVLTVKNGIPVNESSPKNNSYTKNSFLTSDNSPQNDRKISKDFLL